MKEALYEESAIPVKSALEAKLYMAFHVVSIILFILAGLWLTFSFAYINNLIESGATGATLAIYLIRWFLPPALIVGGGLIAFFLKRRFNVSYDYTFVEDELRVTKVYNGRRRKYLMTLKADQILKIGWCEKDSFERTKRGLGKTKFLTSNKAPAEEKEFIYLLYSSSIAKTLYVLECRRIMLEYLVAAAGRNKLERE